MKAKKNIVKMDLGGLQYEVDVEREWQEFKDESFENQLDSVISSYFWMSQIFGVELPQEAKNKFWKDFQRPDAERAREVAAYGLRNVNNWPLFSLLKDAMDFIKARDAGAFVDNPQEGKRELLV